MTITHGIPASNRLPGRYFEYNLLGSARGIVGLPSRILLIGGLLATGTKSAGDKVQVFSDADADVYFGVGSELALMYKWAALGGRDYGSSPEIWCIGMADTGTAAVQLLTITGTPTEGGQIVVKIAGRVIASPVASGDSVTTMAAALDAAIDAMIANLPVTSGAAAGVVTCTAAQKGVTGEDIAYDVISAPAGVTVTPSSSATGATASDITASLDLSEDIDFDFVVSANHTSTDVSDFAAHITATWEAGAKRWRQTLFCETGSLATAQALSAAANDHRQIVVHAKGFKNTPGEIAAYVAATMGGEENPAKGFDGKALPSLYRPDAADVQNQTARKTAINSGLLVLHVNSVTGKPEIVRAVTTKTIHNSVPFFDMLDVSSTRAFYKGARQIDIAQALAFPQASADAETMKAIRSLNIDIAYKLQEKKWWHNVEAHEAEFDVAPDPDNPSRIASAIPSTIVPELHQIINQMNFIRE